MGPTSWTTKCTLRLRNMWGSSHWLYKPRQTRHFVEFVRHPLFLPIFHIFMPISRKKITYALCNFLADKNLLEWKYFHGSVMSFENWRPSKPRSKYVLKKTKERSYQWVANFMTTIWLNSFGLRTFFPLFKRLVITN